MTQIDETTKISLYAAAVILSSLITIALWISTSTQEAKADSRAALAHNVIQDQKIDKVEQAVTTQTNYLIQILERVTRIEERQKQ